MPDIEFAFLAGAASGGVMSRRLRWLAIVVPALAVGLIELLSDSLLDVAFPVPLDTVLIVGVVLALAAAFSWAMFRRVDALTSALAAQNRALEARNATARALHRVSVAITALTELDPILAAVVDNTRALLEADVALLLLAGPDGRLAVRAWSGLADAIRFAGDEGDDDALRFLDPAHAVGRLAAPLQRGGGTIGLLAVGSGSARTFSVDDVEALSSLANQAAIAIENAHLQERLRELAVIEERERIAREMHDGLAQVLGYVNTKSQAVDEYLATGRIDEARTQLAELSGAARSVYVDVREAILGLRSPIVPGAGLVAALEEYARRFAEASKLAVVVSATLEARAAALSPEAEAQVFRIVQESLTNVRKHAEAHRAVRGPRGGHPRRARQRRRARLPGSRASAPGLAAVRAPGDARAGCRGRRHRRVVVPGERRGDGHGRRPGDGPGPGCRPGRGRLTRCASSSPMITRSSATGSPRSWARGATTSSGWPATARRRSRSWSGCGPTSCSWTSLCRSSPASRQPVASP
jgi:signal transduction histidine kinase